MPDALIYAFGVLSGATLILVTQKFIKKAEKAAREEAHRDFIERQALRNDAFNRGYNRAKQDYSNRSEVERLVNTFKGRTVKTAYREVDNR